MPVSSAFASTARSYTVTTKTKSGSKTDEPVIVTMYDSLGNDCSQSQLDEPNKK